MKTSTLLILHNGHTLGTGFLVAKDLVVTCAHVVTQAGDTIQVQFKERDEIISARVIPEYYRDPDNGDIAFLRLESVPETIISLRLGAAEHSPSGGPFRAFGYPSVGEVEGVHARGEMLGMVMENSQRLLQLRSVELNQGYSGAPVWDEKRGVVVGMVVSVYKSDASGKLRDTAFAIPSELLWSICPEICPSETPPYLGLETFTDETAKFFFGREALTEKLLNVLRGGCRFLALFGPSGSGKSSVIRAGLLPALKKDQLPGSHKWTQITMRPVDNPFEQMKTAGFDLIDINGYFKSHADAERVVLFIDQFEELFTLCSENMRERFTSDLATALENSKLILIVSMRDDFYSAFNAKAALLAESEHLKIENVPGNLRRDELVAMIERPADTVGLALEEGLTELILKDLTRDGEARSSTLPLLEFALTQLWEKRRDGRLTHEAYQSNGGVTGSLARWADDAYSGLPKEDQLLAESLLTSLVHLGDETQGLPDTRKRRTLIEVGTSRSVRRVIKHFTDRRLLVTSGKMVELIHDALVREWSKLQGWIRYDRDNLRLIVGISDAARQWEVGAKDKSMLTHRGMNLELGLAIAKNLKYSLNENERAYLDACAGAMEREKTVKATLREVSSVITSALDIKTVATKILEELGKLIQYRQGSIQLIKENRREIIAVRGFDYDGVDKFLIRPINSDPLLQRIVIDQAPIFSDDVTVDPRWETLSETSKDIRPWIGLPLVYGKKVIGLMIFDNDGPGSFSDTNELKETLMPYANLAAVALQYAIINDYARSRYRDLKVISEIAQKLNKKSDTQELILTITSEIRVQLNCAQCTVFFPIDSNEKTYLAPHYGHDQNSTKTIRRIFETGEGIVGWAYLHEESVLLNDASSDPRFSPSRSRQNIQRSLLVVPIKIDKQTIGVICVDQYESNWFAEDDIYLVEILASHVGVALEFSRLVNG